MDYITIFNMFYSIIIKIFYNKGLVLNHSYIHLFLFLHLHFFLDVVVEAEEAIPFLHQTPQLMVKLYMDQLKVSPMFVLQDMPHKQTLLLIFHVMMEIPLASILVVPL